MDPITRFKRICRAHELPLYAEKYVNSCKNGGGDSFERFPNVAGFARSLGIGVDLLRRVRRRYPEQYDAVLALLEDEALNCGKSPTILSAYLKERLDFGEKKEGGASESGAERLKIVFEHNISEDGG